MEFLWLHFALRFIIFSFDMVLVLILKTNGRLLSVLENAICFVIIF